MSDCFVCYLKLLELIWFGFKLFVPGQVRIKFIDLSTTLACIVMNRVVKLESRSRMFWSGVGVGAGAIF